MSSLEHTAWESRFSPKNKVKVFALGSFTKITFYCFSSNERKIKLLSSSYKIYEVVQWNFKVKKISYLLCNYYPLRPSEIQKQKFVIIYGLIASKDIIFRISFIAHCMHINKQKCDIHAFTNPEKKHRNTFNEKLR